MCRRQWHADGEQWSSHISAEDIGLKKTPLFSFWDCAQAALFLGEHTFHKSLYAVVIFFLTIIAIAGTQMGSVPQEDIAYQNA